MSDDKEGKEEPKDPATLAKELEAKLKFNKILLFIAMGLLSTVLCVLGTGYGVIYIKVSAITDAPTDKIDHELEKINEQLTDLKTFREEELASIAVFDEKLNELKGRHETLNSATMKQVLLDREKDYQHLVDTLRSGTESLAGMVAGSRDWVDFYKGEMEALKQHSIRRSSSIESTLSDEHESAENTASSPANPVTSDKAAAK